MLIDYGKLVLLERKGQDKRGHGKKVTMLIEEDLHIYARAQGWGWLTAAVNEALRAKLNEDELYLKAKEKHLKEKLAKIKAGK